MTKAHLKSGGRYPVLRALGILYMVGAVGALCYGLYMTGWALFAAPASMGDRFTMTLQALAATFFGVVTILAIAELIKLVIDIEHNTRIAAFNSGQAGGGNGVPSATGHVNRLAEIADEESAEAALIRGH